jgi:hypothetical protein
VKNYPAIRAKNYITSYSWTWYVLILIILIIGAVVFTNSADWINDTDGKHQDKLDWNALLFIGGYVLSLSMLFMSWLCVDDDREKYRKQIKEVIPSTYQIEARVDNITGEILLYEKTKDAIGTDIKYLKRFTPDEDDQIHAYVAEQRQRLAGPDLSKSKAIAKTINQG